MRKCQHGVKRRFYMVDKRKTRVEVLAPAGSFDIMKAVVAAGADAVYLGGNMFGARAFANNFNTEELIEAIEYAHLFGRKIYCPTACFHDQLRTQIYYDGRGGRQGD